MMLDGLCGPRVITRVLESRGPCPAMVGGGGAVMETEDATWLPSKMEQGAGVKKCRWPLEVSEHKETDCHLEPPDRNAIPLTLWFWLSESTVAPLDSRTVRQ